MMACCSSFSNIIPQAKYDVFLSFRGKDTRQNFTSHLYAALCKKKIETFIDDELTRGDEISPSLLDAIEGSKISVVIFSKGYAYSRWCLDELVKILKCKDKYGQIVIPVFYHVDPSHVRNQTGTFGDAFSKLEEHFKGRLDQLQRWRIALREAANLSGFDSRVTRPESVLVEEIVTNVLKKLNDMFPTDNKELVGVDSTIENIESLLSIGLKDVITLGIWGIGGIGKTTIAGAVFNKISCHFEGSCFIQNVREEAEKTGGLAHLRQELISSILDDGNIIIGIPNLRLNFTGKRLSRKRVLIVFDDVTHAQQVEFLIKGLYRFMLGSRIIITTRDKQVLKNCRVDKIYEVKELSDDYALKLFSQYAFGQNLPEVSYKELSNKIIKYAQGVPLVLKVVGCFLFRRTIEDWESAINKLMKCPHMDIQKVLMVSYDGLDDEEKNIFLDIACFFKGEDKDLVIKFLDCSGYSAEIGLSVLVDKSLVVVSNNKVMMHDLLQEMGREIVRQESVKGPGKRSRLWQHEDIYHVLTKNTGTEAIEGISLDMSKIKEIHLNLDTFTKMHKLRYIKFYSSLYEENGNKVHHVQGLESVFTELRYLHWHGYPLKSLPSNIHSGNLVSLELPYSNVEELWNGTQHLVNLKHINISHSRQLTKIPDLSLAPNLESLNLEGCTSLLETHSSIQYPKKLVILNLKQCRSLKSLPKSIHLESLKELLLEGTAINKLPSSIECLSRLVILNLEDCSRLEQLPSRICNLKSLEHVNLSGCSNLEILPDEFGNLEALKELKVEGIAIREVPLSILCLKNLGRLSFERFKGHEQIGKLLPISFGLHNLTYLKLRDCGITELPESLGQLSSLRILLLDKNNFERIPESIILLSKLFWLSLNYCERLQSLPELPCDLSDVRAQCCASLEQLSGLSILFTPTSWNSQVVNFINCFKLDLNSLREIVENALLKIQLMATAWRKNNDKESLETPSGCICYPGSAIPQWFNFQSMGSSITLKLPPGWFNSNFVGFALCAIVAFQDHHEDGLGLGVFCDCKLKTEDDLVHVSEGSLFVWGDGYIGSDHIFLGYDLHMYSDFFSEYYSNNEVFIEFYLADLDGERIECCKVTKCGIRLLYTQDYNRGSFISDVEEEPHPKRLKCIRSPSQDVPFVPSVFE